MPTHFILDKKLQKQRESMEKILSLVNKKPYPDHSTTHLASFLQACFFVVENEKKVAYAKELEAEKKREWELQARKQREEEERKLKSLEAQVPIPEGIPEDLRLDNTPIPESLGLNVPTPSTQEQGGKREYVLRIYDTPIGVLVDKDDHERYIYNSVEPVIDMSVVEKAKKLYERDVKKNNALFDDITFMRKVAAKVAKSNQINDLFVRKLRYYFERDVLGGGKFDPLLYDEDITTIVCKGTGVPLEIDYKGFGRIKTNIVIKDSKDVNKLMERVAFATNKRLNESNTILDTTFQGLKFEGVMGIGGRSSKLTIRRLKHDL